MGLDSYIYRTKKIKGFTVKDYEKVDNAVNEVKIGEFTNIKDVIKGRTKKGIDELNEVVKVRGEYLNWYSIFEQVGYLRKANAIHHFFVQECQNGVDECQLSIVKKTHLKDLLKRCKRAMSLKDIYLNDGIIKDGEGIETFLPTTSGFFFGGTEFNEWYFNDVEETIDLITKVLKETDFKTQIIFYRSSW
jgi:CRISPR/Cas system-associated endoribonuclease Cas2